MNCQTVLHVVGRARQCGKAMVVPAIATTIGITWVDAPTPKVGGSI